MAITPREVQARTQDITIDDGTRWSVDEFMRFVNDASQAIVMMKPSAYVLRESRTLTAGVVQQAPAGALQVIDVPRNVGGRAIRRVDRDTLDAGHPDWVTMTPSATTRQVMFDPRDPLRFSVYPPSDGTGSLEVVYSAEPPEVTGLDEALPLPRTYLAAYTDYALYRMYSKDADYAANRDLATWYFQSFAQSLGVRIQTQTKYAPTAVEPS